MMLTISGEEFANLSNATRSELLAILEGKERASSVPSDMSPTMDERYRGIDMTNVADLTFKQIQQWMVAASDQTKLGLRVFAEHGPVIRAQALVDAGINNLAHFQSRTTIRTRTITGDKGIFLLGWDDWGEVDNLQGKYAVTPITHQSLRRFFLLG
ncbi:hypothetical protein D9599_19485 [Roseomonas sp. KE2513]|uniref:hypothetical protein n=1 Tax=Roseomonas sp. KE2513 TaxID=2479202 RepID=UPI0018E02F4A|nr:hypothetical protein [Roseomonas sp. KE2513]MBI0537747.1 hypothetical protein [Roseomonas sp. KE2513]